MSFGSKSLDQPTPDQLRRWGLMTEKGCVACIQSGRIVNCGRLEIHHLKSGNLRMGHDFTVCLGAWHHRQVKWDDHSLAGMRDWFGPSLMDGSNIFAERFGRNHELLKYQNELIGWTAEPKRERSARKPYRKARRGPQTQRSTKTLPRRGL